VREQDGSAADAAETRLNRLMNLIVEMAVEMAGFDGATVTVLHGGAYGSVAATDQRWLGLDDAQYADGAGPCLAALGQRRAVQWISGDEEASWRLFCQTAQHAGIASSLSVHLPLDGVEGIEGSLNLYSRQPAPPSAAQVRAAEGYAGQLAVAMQSVEEHRATARMARGLAEAMRTRAVIEQAKGILISEEGVDADRAFELLREISNQQNVKLHEVAQRLVDERSKSV
jgi:hypothetical protein